MIKKSEAETLIKTIWLKQPDKCNKDILYPVSFHQLIESNYPDLLNFKYPGTKYQLIKGWVSKWQNLFCNRLDDNNKSVPEFPKK